YVAPRTADVDTLSRANSLHPGARYLQEPPLEHGLSKSNAGKHFPIDWRDLAQRRPRLPIRIGTRRCPQLPGRASNKPGIAVEQISQRPSSVSRQVVMSYQSRPIIRSPQPGQYV